MRGWLVLTVLSVAAAGVAAHPLSTIAERDATAEPAPAARSERVSGVALDGDRLPLSLLRDVLATRVGEQLDAAALVHDRAIIRETLVDRGYLDADVDAPVITHSANGAYVWLAVRPGPLYHVRLVRVVASAAGPVHGPFLTLATGDDARASAIEDARVLVASHATVHLTRDRAAATVDVDLVAP
jgi:hypothetical protein